MPVHWPVMVGITGEGATGELPQPMANTQSRAILTGGILLLRRFPATLSVERFHLAAQALGLVALWWAGITTQPDGDGQHEHDQAE